MSVYLKSTSYYRKKLSELTEDEFIDFYNHIEDDMKPYLLMTDCKRLTNAVDRITIKLSIKVHFWEFWKQKCPFCSHLMIGGRTLHCGRYECNEQYQRSKV